MKASVPDNAKPVVRQAGAIAVRGEGPDAEVVLVRAKKNPSDWIFPKGHIEPGETAAQAALRELGEEAGVSGEVMAPVGVSTFQSEDERVEVVYFLVRAVDSSQQAEREVRWYPFPKARAALTYEDARHLLVTAEALLKNRES